MRKSKLCSKLVSMAAAAVVAFSGAIALAPFSADASTANAAVNADKNGILEIEVYYQPTGEEETLVQTGTGFLINETTLLTCSHVINIDDVGKDILEDVYKDDFDKDFVSVRIVALGDVTEKASVIVDSPEYDYAILSVSDNSLKTKTPLTLSSSQNVSQTQEVYALGFPSIVSYNQNNKSYAPFGTDDVTITNGKISKIDYVFNDNNGTWGYTNPNGRFIQHGAPLSDGNSGGPLVDENGYVIGMNALVVGSFNYAVVIDQIEDMLDMKGIQYDKVGSVGTETQPAETTQAPETVSDTAEAGEVTPPPVTTTTAAPTYTDPVDSLTSSTGEGSSNTMLIIIISAVAVILIIVVALIIALGGKKKAPQTVNPTPVVPTVPPVSPYGPGSTGPAPAAPMGGYGADSGSGDTTLLNVGAGETSVLGGGASRSTATLVRRRNGTIISVNKPEFIIGKERNRVDCCVSNNAISRQHAKITCSGGIYFITDLNSSNYTYVNGTQIPPHEPTQLKPGDTIKLADEEFEFRG